MPWLATASALRLALAPSWLFLVAAELIASSMGQGFLLLDSGQNGGIGRIFLAILSIAVLGKLTDSLLGVFERCAIAEWAGQRPFSEMAIVAIVWPLKAITPFAMASCPTTDSRGTPKCRVTC